MGMRILMSGAITGGVESGIAQIDCPATGNIVGVFWCANTQLVVDNDFSDLQLSFGSAYAATNDSRMIISFVRQFAKLATAVGLSAPGLNVNDFFGTPIPVNMGERIWMHASTTAAKTGIARAMLSFDFDLDRPSVRRR